MNLTYLMIASVQFDIMVATGEGWTVLLERLERIEDYLIRRYNDLPRK